MVGQGNDRNNDIMYGCPLSSAQKSEGEDFVVRPLMVLAIMRLQSGQTGGVGKGLGCSQMVGQREY